MYPVKNINIKAERLQKDQRSINEVKQMGAYKTLVTFASKEEMEDILAMGDDVSCDHFDEIWLWSIEEVT